MNQNRQTGDDCSTQVDFCVPTFKRPKAVERLLLSIAAHYPLANIYVADQNETLDREFYGQLGDKLAKVGLVKDISVEQLPYDCGLSYARNQLVLNSPSPYKLILDDDHVFTTQTDITKFVRLLEAHPRAGIVGGRVTHNGRDQPFEFNLEKTGDTLMQVADGQELEEENGVRYKKTGCVHNFALMRKTLFDHIRWDPELKVTEHMDFYLRMKEVPYYILYTPDVLIEHPPVERDGDYEGLRRRTEFLARMLRKHGARRVRYLNGDVREVADDGSITIYRDPAA